MVKKINLADFLVLNFYWESYIDLWYKKEYADQNHICSWKKRKTKKERHTCIKVRPILEYDWMTQNVGHNRCCHHTGNSFPFLTWRLPFIRKVFDALDYHPLCLKIMGCCKHIWEKNHHHVVSYAHCSLDTSFLCTR